MIDSKEKLVECLNIEEKLYKEIGYKGRLHTFITQCEVGKIFQYITYLRKDELYSNSKRTIINNALNLYYRRKHNRLGWLLGISIPCNTFGKGLLIYHSQGIIVHKDAKCGEYCRIHGNVCIGNSGAEKYLRNTPRIGNNVDIRIGSAIIGGVNLADQIKVAAGAVVCKSCEVPGTVLAGVPAKELKRVESQRTERE